jgi:hypothetical protein
MKSITLKVFCCIVVLSVVSAFNLGPIRLKTLTSLNAASTITSQKTRKSTSLETTQQKIAILICPAQFCVPADYQNFIKSLHQRNPSIVTAKVAPLPRTEWIKVARQVPTRSFFSSELNNAKTLKWYFDAIETSLAEIYAETDDDTKICIIAHSIGGWVARAYLGGLGQSSTAVSRSALEKCSSLITLGSPHYAPDTALVDQTRGLLKQVESTFECSSEFLSQNGIKVTCVGSQAVKSSLVPTGIEEIVATTSYFPLISKWNSIISGPVVGDGIIPKDLAFMESPAKKILLESCSITGNPVRHAHVLPTPWNLWDGYAPSIELPTDYTWYGSDGVIDQWIDSIQ